MQSVMDRKKKKTITAVWRPVSTQSSSNEEGLVKDVKVELESSYDLDHVANPEVGSKIEEVHYSISSSVSHVQHTSGEGEVVNEPVDPDLSSSKLQDGDKGNVQEGGSMPSAEKHSISIEAGTSLMRFIKGKGGYTQKRIEEETGVKIIFPSSKKEDSLIIEGISAESVTKASEKVQVIIDEAVKSPTLDYSHFVSLPLAIHPELVNKLVNFQNSIIGITDPNQDENLDSDTNAETSDEEDKDQHLDKAPNVAVEPKAQDSNEHARVNITNIPLVSYPPKVSKSSALESKTSTLSALGIEKSIFIKPKTFHLTVLMLKLWNKERVDAAAEVLRSVSLEVMDALENRPVSVGLNGLECMRGSFAKACVLYVPVKEIGGEDRLLRACKVIIDAFVKAGLVLEKDAEQKLKLHATVMNARHRKRKKRTRKVDFFDARSIVDQYGSEEWGEYLIREAHLSQRFAFHENGYYSCCASIPFPENMQQD